PALLAQIRLRTGSFHQVVSPLWQNPGILVEPRAELRLGPVVGAEVSQRLPERAEGLTAHRPGKELLDRAGLPLADEPFGEPPHEARTGEAELQVDRVIPVLH